MDSRIFIVASERSGSNLVRRILGAHSEIEAPPAPHLWRNLSRTVHYYGDLRERGNIDKLIGDAIYLVNAEGSKADWKLNVSPQEVMEGLEHYNLSGALVRLYDLYASKHGSKSWVCKERDLFHHGPRIKACFQNAGFVYLYRDGRDVALSERRVPSKDRALYLMADEWKKEQAASIRFFQDLEGDKAVAIKYEDLIEDPERETKRMCEALGLSFEEQMLRFHEEESSKSDASKSRMWENLSKPVLSGNKMKYKEEMKKKDRWLFERVAANELKVLGYPLEFEDPPAISSFEELRIRFLNKLDKFFDPREKHMEESHVPFHERREAILKDRKKRIERLFG